MLQRVGPSTPEPIVAVLLDAWTDLDRVIDRLTDEAAESDAQGSAHAWTVGHLANQVDGWINVRFAGGHPHRLVGDDRFRFGADGRATDWLAIRSASVEVRAQATSFLERLAADDLERTIPYPGSLPELIGRTVSLRYTLLRVLAHHYFHIGEIASKRSGRGESVGDYPGPLLATLRTDA